MNEIGTVKGAWFVEAMGEFSRTLDRVDTLIVALAECTDAQNAAVDRMNERLAAFDRHMSAITENAKTKTLKHIATRTDEAARRLIERQRGEIAEMVRGAFGRELEVKLSRVDVALQRLSERQRRSWEDWLLYAAAVGLGSALTLAI
jgi:site-specific recombinase